MKHINDAVIRMLEARIRVLKIKLQDALDESSDERKITQIQTAIEEYVLILNDLKAK